MAASLRNSIGLDCMRSRQRHLIATWIYKKRKMLYIIQRLLNLVTISYSLIAIGPNALLHNAEFAGAQLFIDAYRIRGDNVLVVGQFRRRTGHPDRIQRSC